MKNNVIAIDNSGEMNTIEAAKYVSDRIRRPYTAKSLSNRISAGQGPRYVLRFGLRVFLAADLEAWLSANTTVVKAFSR